MVKRKSSYAGNHGMRTFKTKREEKQTMAKQTSLKQAHEQGYLELSNWAQLMLQRIRMNFEVQKIYTGMAHTGPYKDFWIVNAARRGKYKSTGEAFMKQNLRAKVMNGAGGNTEVVSFFFRRYLYFVDWGVGAGQDTSQVPDTGTPNMKKRYNRWNGIGDRQRRPVVLGAIRGSRFFLGKILQDYWSKEAQLAIAYGLGYADKDNEYMEFAGDWAVD